MTTRRSHSDRPARPAPRRGFTLIEAVISLAILSIIVVALGSAMLIASRAVPDADSPTQRILDAGQALECVASELCYALSVAQPTENSLEFTVPDRTGDGAPETVRYAWSGAAGDPITRTYNGGDPVAFLDNVHWSDIALDLTPVGAGGGAGNNEGAEQLLIAHDDSGGSHVWRVVEPFKWGGQYLRPQLPTGAVGWRITRVRFRAQRAGIIDGSDHVALVVADGQCRPTGDLLASTTLLELNLTGDPDFQEFAFPSLPVLDPDTGVCLLIVHSLGLQSCWLRGESGGTDTPDAHFINSTDQGKTWNDHTGIDLCFEVYGTVLTDAAAGGTLCSVTGVRIGVQVGDDPAARLRTAVRLFNRPEVTVP